MHKTYAQRFTQIDSLFYDNKQIFKDSASFFNAADKIAALAKREGDEDLYLEAEYIRWRYYPFSLIRKDYAYLEQKMALLLKEAEQKNIQHLQIRIKDNLGLYFYKTGNYGKALEQYLNAYYLLKNISLKEFPNRRDYIYNDLASIYYNLNDYNNAAKFLLEADTLPIFLVPHFPKIRLVINTSNTLGLIYRKTFKMDSALYFFNKAYNIAEKERDSVWIGIASGNIGITYFLQKKYVEAIPLLEKDVQLSTKAGEYHNAANSLIKLAEITMFYKDKAKAEQQLLYARELTAITYDQNKLLNDLFPLMAKFYAGKGNLSLAYRYADSAMIVKDSIFIQNSALALARAQQKTDVEHHLAEVRGLESQQKIRTLQRNGLLCIVALMIAVTALLIGRQRLLKKQKLFAEVQKQQALSELETAKQRLHSFTANIRDKNELIERLTTEMNQLQIVLDAEAIDFRRQTLEQLRKSTILTDDEWLSFRSAFEKAYPGWFSGLQEKLPGLTAADLRFLALNKLKFNAKEMAAILGISPGSIRMSRHRLRKKYNLEDDAALEMLVDNL